MDEKLSMMAKSTVFAGCSRRALLKLGALFDVVQLSPGSAVPAGSGWLHLVLAGQALAVEDGTASCVIGEGQSWLRPAASIRYTRTEGVVVALSGLTLASVARRAMGAVERWGPEVAARLQHGDCVGVPADAVVGYANDVTILVGSVSHG